MTLKFDVTPEVEAGLIAQARAEGLTLEQFLNRTLEAIVQNSTQPIPQHADEWAHSFRNWIHSHSTDKTPLSDEAISREFIYRDRGL